MDKILALDKSTAQRSRNIQSALHSTHSFLQQSSNKNALALKLNIICLVFVCVFLSRSFYFILSGFPFR